MLLDILDKNGKVSSIKLRKLSPDVVDQLLRKFKVTTVLEAAYLEWTKSSTIPRCSCGKPAKFKNAVVGYSSYCSGSCATKASVKRGKTSHLSFPDVREKIRSTVMKRYGVDNVSKIADVTEKKKVTNRVRFGKDWFLQTEELKELNRNNRVSRPERYASVRKQAKQTLQTNWLNKRLGELSEKLTSNFNNSEWKGSNFQHSFHCKRCNINFLGWLKDGLDPRCPNCEPISISSQQLKLIDFLKKHHIEVIVNDRKQLDGLEIDIYLPAFKIGIEINGNYWHSLHPKNYHYEKSKLAHSRGIRLIHIFEDDNQDKVEHRLLSLLNRGVKIGARNTQVKEISIKEAGKFLSNFHLNGAGISPKFACGLWYNETLVSVMTFGKSRFRKGIEWEVFRYASAINIAGGASKLFKFFCQTKSPQSVLSYSERTWNFDDAVYSKLNFKKAGYTQLGFWYVGVENGWTRESRFKYQKHQIATNDELRCLTERQIMEQRGFRQLFDCGNIVWIWTSG